MTTRDDTQPQAQFAISRRAALGGGAGVAIVASLPSSPAAAASPLPAGTQYQLTVRTTINGQPETLAIDPRTSLLDMLRERLGLTGAKKGCDHGQCGACTVHIDGQRVASCLTLAAKVDGHEVLTIEGLSQGGRAASDAAGLH